MNQETCEDFAIYLHGFGGHPPTGRKLKAIQDAFPNRVVVTPTIDWLSNPSFDIYPYMSQGGEVSVIGSSLGGALALKLCEEYGVDVVAINPPINVRKSIKAYLGSKVVDDDSIHVVSDEDVEKICLIQYDLSKIFPSYAKIVVGMEDDLIDPNETMVLANLHAIPMVIVPRMGHRPTDDEFEWIVKNA